MRAWRGWRKNDRAGGWRGEANPSRRRDGGANGLRPAQVRRYTRCIHACIEAHADTGDRMSEHVAVSPSRFTFAEALREMANGATAAVVLLALMLPLGLIA